VLKDLGEDRAVALFDETQTFHADALDSPLAQVASVRFLIQNTVEDVISVDIQQRLRLSPDAVGQTGCWSDYFQTSEAATSLGGSTIGETLSPGSVDLVFTKHPTESKRWSILRLQRRLSRAIRQYRVAQVDDGEFALVFELLWRSGELFTEKPSLEKGT
jgi:phosphoenolpyruvate carboxylase